MDLLSYRESAQAPATKIQAYCVALDYPCSSLGYQNASSPSYSTIIELASGGLSKHVPTFVVLPGPLAVSISSQPPVGQRTLCHADRG